MSPLRNFLFRFHGWRERKWTTIRSWYYSKVFAASGERLRIYGKITVYSPDRVKVGKHVLISEGAILHGRGFITIGDHVHISSRAILNTQTLDYRTENWPPIRKPITIRDYAWVASNALIVPGITVGEGAIVGMGAVVTHDVPDYTVVAGNPARKIAEVPTKVRCEICPETEA